MNKEEIIEALYELTETMWAESERTQDQALLYYRDEIKELIEEIQA